MANARIGSHPSHGYQVVETVDTTKQLDRNDSGKLFMLNNSSSFTINLPKLSTEIAGKNIIIVEDVIDSGNTINFVKEFIDNKNPKSLKIATLLLKPKIAKLSFKIDWVGFEISSEFVVGYGLDYNQKLRNLNAVYILGGS